MRGTGPRLLICSGVGAEMPFASVEEREMPPPRRLADPLMTPVCVSSLDDRRSNARARWEQEGEIACLRGGAFPTRPAPRRAVLSQSLQSPLLSQVIQFKPLVLLQTDDSLVLCFGAHSSGPECCEEGALAERIRSQPREAVVKQRQP